MHDSLKPTVKDLSKFWMFSRSSDTRQMTVRLPVDTFFKLQALESMFSSRSRNEMVSDLLNIALEQFIESLQGFGVLPDGSLVDRSVPEFDQIGFISYEGPLYEFWDFYNRLKPKPESSDSQVDTSTVKTALHVLPDEEVAA